MLLGAQLQTVQGQKQSRSPAASVAAAVLSAIHKCCFLKWAHPTNGWRQIAGSRIGPWRGATAVEMRPAFHSDASFFGYAGEQLAVGTPFLFDWIDKNGWESIGDAGQLL
jgi:hypothetical protein